MQISALGPIFAGYESQIPKIKDTINMIVSVPSNAAYETHG